MPKRFLISYETIKKRYHHYVKIDHLFLCNYQFTPGSNDHFYHVYLSPKIRNLYNFFFIDDCSFVTAFISGMVTTSTTYIFIAILSMTASIYFILVNTYKMIIITAAVINYKMKMHQMHSVPTTIPQFIFSINCN